MAGLLDDLTDFISDSPDRRWLRPDDRYDAAQLASIAFLSVPHWFDLDVLASLRDELGARDPREIVAETSRLRVIRERPHGVFTAVEKVRLPVLERLARDAAPLFRRLSAAYAAAFDRCGRDLWPRLEHLYHAVAADPVRGCADLLRTAVIWKSDPYFETDSVSDLADRLREQLDRGLAGRHGPQYLLLCRSYLPGGATEADDAADTLRSALTQRTDPLLQAEARLRVGAAELRASRVDAALAEFDAAHATFEAIGDERGRAETLRRIARAHLRVDRYDEAAAAYAAAASSFDRAGGSVSKAHCAKGMAEIELYRGRLPAAAEGFERALAEFGPTNARIGEANTRIAYVDVKILRGRLKEARSDIALAYETYRAVDEDLGLGNCLQAEGKIEFEVGDYFRALDLFDAAREKFRTVKRRASFANASFRLAASLTQLDQPDVALPVIREALDQADEVGDRGARAWGLRQLGLAMEKKGSLAEALDALACSAGAFNDLGDPLEESITGLELVRVAHALGFPAPFDPGSAGTRVAAAAQLFEAADMPRYLDRARGLAAMLTPRTDGTPRFAFDG